MLSLLLSIHCIFLLSNGQTIFNRTYIQSATTVGSSSVCEGGSQTFNCTIESFIETFGYTIPDAIWSRNGSVIDDSTLHHTLLRTNIRGRPTVTGLMVDSTTLDDNGAVYTCTANGAPADFATNVTLNVVRDLPSPSTLTASDTSCLTTSVIVSWPPFSSNELCGSISYNVMVSPSDGVNLTNLTDTRYNFYGLKPGNTYTVTVAGINQAGMGIPGDIMFNILTEDMARPGGITNLMNTTYEPSAITFTWAAASSPFCGEVMYYLAILSSDEYYNTMNVSMTTATFSNLTSNTNYTITVSAVNEGGAGMSTTIMNISTSPPDDNQNTTVESSESEDTGLIIGIIVAVIVIIVIIIIIVISYCIYKKKKDPKDDATMELKSPTSTSEGPKMGKSSVQPSEPSSVPHQAATSGEEYAVSTKAVPRQRQQQQPQEYAMVDKSKKASASQGITYADLQALPSSGNAPPPNQGPSTYAMVA